MSFIFKLIFNPHVKTYRVIRTDRPERCMIGEVTKSYTEDADGAVIVSWRAASVSGEIVGCGVDREDAARILFQRHDMLLHRCTPNLPVGKPIWAAPVVEQSDVKTFLRVDAEDDAETQAAAYGGDPEANQLWHEKSVIRGIEKPGVSCIGDHEIVARVGNRVLAKAITPRSEDGCCDVYVYRGGRMVAIARSEGEARRVLAEEARIALRVERGLDPR